MSTFSVSEHQAYGVTKQGLDFEELSVLTRQLGDKEVLMRVLCNGVCGSDIHQCAGEWRTHGVDIVSNNIRTVPGHEAISIVVALGKDVTGLKLFDRVGCGPIRDSCKTCTNCNKDLENLCTTPGGVKKLYSRTDTGGFGAYIQAPEDWCFPIPDEIPNEAAPLLCAGVTTFTPLTRSNIPQGAKVAVIGVGGLGLMGIQYSIALGYETYALTTSSDKRELLMSLGCKDVILYKTDSDQIKSHSSTFDFILNTVSAAIDTSSILSLLKPQGELCYCGLGEEPIVINPFSLVGPAKRISGSFVGGIKDTKDMLEFSAKHKIFPIVETIKVPFGHSNADTVSEWVKKVDAGKIRYRLVLDYDVDVEEVKKQVASA